MGRGRAKAKQVKVARQLKYNSGGTDLDRLRNELGVGMAAVVAAGDADLAVRVLAARDVTGWVLGEVTGPGDGARLVGAHPL